MRSSCHFVFSGYAPFSFCFNSFSMELQKTWKQYASIVVCPVLGSLASYCWNLELKRLGKCSGHMVELFFVREQARLVRHLSEPSLNHYLCSFKKPSLFGSFVNTGEPSSKQVKLGSFGSFTGLIGCRFLSEKFKFELTFEKWVIWNKLTKNVILIPP